MRLIPLMIALVLAGSSHCAHARLIEKTKRPVFHVGDSVNLLVEYMYCKSDKSIDAVAKTYQESGADAAGKEAGSRPDCPFTKGPFTITETLGIVLAPDNRYFTVIRAQSEQFESAYIFFPFAVRE